jgi:hypothetical protein
MPRPETEKHRSINRQNPVRFRTPQIKPLGIYNRTVEITAPNQLYPLIVRTNHWGFNPLISHIAQMTTRVWPLRLYQGLTVFETNR